MKINKREVFMYELSRLPGYAPLVAVVVILSVLSLLVGSVLFCVWLATFFDIHPAVVAAGFALLGVGVWIFGTLFIAYRRYRVHLAAIVAARLES